MICSYIYSFVAYPTPARYDPCKIITGVLNGYYNIAKLYVATQHVCLATLFAFIIAAVFLRYLVKLGLDLSYGRLSAANPETINGLSWALGIAFAFVLGNFVVLILNPIFALIFIGILLVVFIRLGKK